MGNALDEVDGCLGDADNRGCGSVEIQDDGVREAWIDQAPSVNLCPIHRRSGHAIRAMTDGDMLQKSQSHRQLVLGRCRDDDVFAELFVRNFIHRIRKCCQTVETARPLCKPWFHRATQVFQEGVIVEQKRREGTADFDDVVVR